MSTKNMHLISLGLFSVVKLSSQTEARQIKQAQQQERGDQTI
jgi:hypothetical protein